MKDSKESIRSKENRLIKEHIQRIFDQSKGRYGAPKIHEIIKKEQLLKVIPSLKRIQRFMKHMGLFAVVFKRFRPQRSKSNDEALPNLLEQDFSAKAINQKWVGDITYIHTLRDGWCYLASIMDLASQKIVGYEFSRSMDASLVVKALRKAMFNQNYPKGVIIHTDRGSQYLSKEYLKATDQYQVRRSYSAKANPYDNAAMESFHAILKKEEVYQNTYINYEHAKLALFEYIEGWYNRNRIHGSIGFMTPVEFEKSVA